MDVLVLGAGITGIAAARTLEVGGITNFLVLEATDRIGGCIRECDGTNIEVGANWLLGLDCNDKNHHSIWCEWVECDEDGPTGSVTPDPTSVYNVMGNDYDNSTYSGRNGAFRNAYRKAKKNWRLLLIHL